MRLDGTIDTNLAGAIASAKRLKDKPVYPDTLEHWSALLAEARQQMHGFDAHRASLVTGLIEQLEHELAERRDRSQTIA